MAIVFVAEQLVDGVTGRDFGHIEFLVEHGQIVEMGTAVARPIGIGVIVLHVSDEVGEHVREVAQSDHANHSLAAVES